MNSEINTNISSVVLEFNFILNFKNWTLWFTYKWFSMKSDKENFRK